MKSEDGTQRFVKGKRNKAQVTRNQIASYFSCHAKLLLKPELEFDRPCHLRLYNIHTENTALFQCSSKLNSITNISAILEIEVNQNFIRPPFMRLQKQLNANFRFTIFG